MVFPTFSQLVEKGTDVDAGTDGRQPPGIFEVGGHTRHAVTRVTPSEYEGQPAIAKVATH